MIEVLMYSSDPIKISPYLKKCFEAIDDLEFNEGISKHTILSIISA